MTPREQELETELAKAKRQCKISCQALLFVMGERDRAKGIPPQQDNADYLYGYELEETNHAPMRLNS